MKSVNVSLKSDDTTASIKEFVNILNGFDCDFDLSSGRYIIDAKSIMGIFSLDLSREIELVIHSNDEAKIASVESAIKNFIV